MDESAGELPSHGGARERHAVLSSPGEENYSMGSPSPRMLIRWYWTGPRGALPHTGSQSARRAALGPKRRRPDILVALQAIDDGGNDPARQENAHDQTADACQIAIETVDIPPECSFESEPSAKKP
jgi:hypothetical protein